MPKFTVTYRLTGYKSVTIEAESAEKAREQIEADIDNDNTDDIIAAASYSVMEYSLFPYVETVTPGWIGKR